VFTTGSFAGRLPSILFDYRVERPLTLMHDDTGKLVSIEEYSELENRVILYDPVIAPRSLVDALVDALVLINLYGTVRCSTDSIAPSLT
jgi:hypothetical protein